MGKKMQTPLGYLMDLLDVRLSDLGDYLYVARTTISKWKTGARALGPGSDHFDGTVEYFTMITRDPARGERVLRLLRSVYPERDVEDAEDIADGLRAFLGRGALPSAAQRREIGDGGQLYTAQVSVFSGEAGCRAALAQAGAHLDEAPTAQVSLLMREDACGLLSPLERIGPGHTLRLLSDAPCPAAALGAYAQGLMLPGTQARLLAPDAPFVRHASCLLCGKDLLLLAHATPGQAPYAALHGDALTTAQWQAVFDSLWDAGETAAEDIPLDQIGPRLFTRTRDHYAPEPVDWVTCGLPYTTMSGELLMEVLRSNDVSGRVWTRILDGAKVLSGVPMRLLTHVRSLCAPQAELPELSMLCGRRIALTAAQSRRHMLDTAARLRAGAGLSIVALQAEAAEAAVPSALSMLVHRNAFGAYLRYGSGLVRAVRSARLVETMMAAADLLAASATSQMRENAHIASLLEQAALEEG